jgi:hypothetical protein
VVSPALTAAENVARGELLDNGSYIEQTSERRHKESERYKIAGSAAYTFQYIEEMDKITSLIWSVKFLLLCTVVRSSPTPEIIDLGYGLDEKTQFWPGTQRYNVIINQTQENVNGIPW